MFIEVSCGFGSLAMLFLAITIITALFMKESVGLMKERTVVNYCKYFKIALNSSKKV